MARSSTRATLTALVSAAVLAGGCQAGSPSSSSGAAAKDDGTVITMWTRAPTAPFTGALVTAYNKSHKNKVRLTVIPADSYQQKVGTAAGARRLPDILASDVVYAPNYAAHNLYLDISQRVRKLPFAGKLAAAHMRTATRNGRIYAVPHDIDLSAMFYNTVLFKRAGLDPDQPPTTMNAVYADAAKINRLGGGVHGFYIDGSCPGCWLFKTWPTIWASGGTVLNPQGTASTIDNPVAANVYRLYRKIWQAGLTPKGSKNENGPTQTQAFADGKIGLDPLGATALQIMKEGKDLQVGVAPIPGLTGGSSSFVGGDVVGISSGSPHAAQSWDFISWTLTARTQVDVVAANKNITVRTDLENNKYAQADPRLRTFNRLAARGRTPISVNFGKTYNDPNGPWTATAYDAVFGAADPAAALHRHNPAITSSLASR